MIDREKVIKGLMKLHGSEETMDIVFDAICLLKEQEERIKMLEHQLETITRWRAEAGAFD